MPSTKIRPTQKYFWVIAVAIMSAAAITVSTITYGSAVHESAAHDSIATANQIACNDLLASTALPSAPTLLDALYEAETDFQIHVFNKNVGNRQKLLVLVAPLTPSTKSHLPNLLTHFQYVGIVGASTHNSWGERVNSSVFQPFQPISQKLKSLRQEFKLARLLTRIYGPYKLQNEITKSDLPNDRTIVDLERQHTPTVWENGDSIWSHATITWGLVAGFYAIFHHIPHTITVSSYMLSAFSMYRYSSLAIVSAPRFKPTAWFQRFFPLSVAILNGRNRTVVNNVRETVETLPDVSELLAIVSPGQIDSVASALSRNGYQLLQIQKSTKARAENRSDYEQSRNGLRTRSSP